MKYIYMVRHGKSSWKDETLEDWERPLNKRGLREAPEMARRVAEYAAERGVAPQLLLSSHARRAKDTAAYFVEALAKYKPQLAYDERIYEGHLGENNIFEIIWGLDDGLECVAMFGHNPAFTDFVNYFGELENLPTSGVAVICFEAERWREVGVGNGRLVIVLMC